MIRQARPSDAEPLLQIYRPIVETTASSFELATPTASEFAARIERSLERHDWLVMDVDGALRGYAYATALRARDAYRRSTETSVYVHPDHQGQGAGRALYQALFVSLRARDYHMAFAAIALPNDASIALHRAVGFEHIGEFREVGHKFGRWHDVSWWQRAL